MAQDQPLSVIDWVKRNPHQPAMTSAIVPNRFEPPVTPNALAPEVTVQPLAQAALRIIGLVPASVTGLPQSLWSGSTSMGLTAQLKEVPNYRLPAAQALLYTLLLTEATAPGDNPDAEAALTLARANTLVRFGAHDAAIALLEQSDVTGNAKLFSAFTDLALMTGEEDTACAILAAQPHLSPSLTHKAFCAARRGDWPTAALLYDSGRSLDTITGADALAMERFLHTESFEGAPPLPRPKAITPLLFRLHEAVGEPLPTGTLPRAYAVADLRDLAGWKTQLDAAERLATTGALPANRLLGLYTARVPAASGGVWNRVSAVQRFETALRTRSTEAIAKSLPPAWNAMEAVGLELVFAEIFAEPVARYTLDGDAGEIAMRMAFLSPDYVTAAGQKDAPSVLAGIALGKTEALSAQSPREQAVLNGFDQSFAREDYLRMAQNERMGEAILRALSLLEDGAAGDPLAMTEALATLRAFGLEDTVRRTALQVLLLERFQ
ncbi:MAG: hypothetical protein AAF665_12175 [Pseudomonadota bacterium]